MAGSGVEGGAGFWLPSEFFDDFDKENLDKTHSDSEFCFPTEFPYYFEIDTGHNTEEVCSQKWRVMSTSPQSTLSHPWAGGSSNGSPTLLAAENVAVEELVYRAAGKLKLDGGDVPGLAKHPALHKSLEQLHPVANKPSPSVFHNIYLKEKLWQQKQKQWSGMWHKMYPVQKNPTRIGRSGSREVLSGGAAMKRECAGTGVFLPRRSYDGNISSNHCAANAYYSSDSGKRPGHSSAPYIPERSVYALNKNFDRINGYVTSQPQFRPKFNPGFASEYALLMARKNALNVQHRRSLLLEKSSPVSRGMCLPQEWTY